MVAMFGDGVRDSAWGILLMAATFYARWPNTFVFLGRMKTKHADLKACSGIVIKKHS